MALEDLQLKKISLNGILGRAIYNYGCERCGERRWHSINQEQMYSECRGYVTTEILSGHPDSFVELGFLAGFETPEDEIAFILKWS